MSHQTVATLVPYFNFLYSVSQLETLHSIIPPPPLSLSPPPPPPPPTFLTPIPSSLLPNFK